MTIRSHRGLPGLAALLLALGCVEIDPSYGESGSVPASSTSSGSSEESTSASTSAGTCECGELELCEDGTCTAPTRILFVNLEGVTTTFGNADASVDSQNLYAELEGTWAGYSSDAAERQALLDAITAQWAPFRVVVTDTRPDASVSTPYMMAVVTADPPPAGFEGVAWIAFPDCGDLIPRDVTFVFNSPADGFGLQSHANAVSGSIARSFGLQPTDSPDDITGFGDRFVDQCFARSQSPPCDAHDPGHCGGDATQQNSVQELATLLGLRG